MAFGVTHFIEIIGVEKGFIRFKVLLFNECDLRWSGFFNKTFALIGRALVIGFVTSFVTPNLD